MLPHRYQYNHQTPNNCGYEHIDIAADYKPILRIVGSRAGLITLARPVAYRLTNPHRVIQAAAYKTKYSVQASVDTMTNAWAEAVSLAVNRLTLVTRFVAVNQTSNPD